MSEAVARILSASPTVSFQDAGRHGFRKLGIAPAGALDRFAAAQANRLLRNDPDATTLEIGPGGLTILVTPIYLACARRLRIERLASAFDCQACP